MESLEKIQNALDRAKRVEEILKGENPSPERAEVAKELVDEHFRHLADLDSPEVERDATKNENLLTSD